MPKTLEQSFEDLLQEVPTALAPETELIMHDLFFVGAHDCLSSLLNEAGELNADEAVEAAREALRGPFETRGENGPIERAFNKFMAAMVGGRPRHRLLPEDLEAVCFYSGAHALLRFILAEDSGVDLKRAQTVAGEIAAWRKKLREDHTTTH